MEISKITNIINQINEIHVLKDINVTNGIFTSLDSRSSVHYVLFPLLNILGYNVFNPSEVKVNDGKDITIYEGDKKLIKINLVDLNKINDVEAFKKDFEKSQLPLLGVEQVKLQIWSTGIHYSLYNGLDKLIDFDIRKLETVNNVLLFKLLLKESLIESINNEKFFNELLIESKFGNLRNTEYVRNAIEDQLRNPSAELINLIVNNIHDSYCANMDKELLNLRLTEEFRDNSGSLLDILKPVTVEATVVEVKEDTSTVNKPLDPYLSLDVLDEKEVNSETVEESLEINKEDVPVVEVVEEVKETETDGNEEKDDLDFLLNEDE